MYNITILSKPPVTDMVASGVNDSGQIVGWYRNSTGEHGFLDDNGSFTTIDVPDANGHFIGTTAAGINDSREIVGDVSFTVSWANGSLFQPFQELVYVPLLHQYFLRK
jgi:probable HAF family extracellular repeat protein